MITSLTFPRMQCIKTGKVVICPDCKKEIDVLQLEYGDNKKEIIPACECFFRRQKEHQETLRLQEKIERMEKVFPTWLLGKKFQQCSFDNFIVREGTKQVYKVTREYAKNFPPKKGSGLLLMGSVGNGKSHLAAAIIREVKNKGYFAIFANVPDTLSRIRATFDQGSEETESQMLDALRNADLVILDDLAVEKQTDWKMEIIYQIIDSRYRAELPIVITTNANMAQLRKCIGDRTFDRISEMCRFLVNRGTSYRQDRR